MEKFKNLERVVCKELEKLDSDYTNKNEFTEADAKRFDMLAHAWKSLLTAEVMHEAGEGKEYDDMSYARGRNMRNGRYMSREVGDAMSGYYSPEWIDPRVYNGRSGYYY